MKASLEHSHDKEDIRKRLRDEHGSSYLRDAILGGIDGCVTTIAVVASVAGAGLPGMIAFVLGVASLVADALSMGVSNYQAVSRCRLILARVSCARMYRPRQPAGRRIRKATEISGLSVMVGGGTGIAVPMLHTT